MFPHRHRRLITPLCAAALSLGSAFASAQDDVSVTLRDGEGQAVGDVTLTTVPSGVLIVAELDGLPPGAHGFHLHETGLCEADDGFKSAGGHLAGNRSHGLLVEGGPHPGDMPNLHVPDSGELHVEVLNTLVSLSDSGEGALLDADGAALMIHSGPDDYESQPSGEAGSRIACAEIGSGG